ncbi:MAG: helix-turn-helix domain-containing protein [Sphaerochaetaceae bacterium]|nr:helix-turn-helix domain-containing protein [Sphaerochaetaceae bacterium]
MQGRIMIIDPLNDINVIKGLASPVRVGILNELRKGEKNVNELAELLHLPQSTVATNVMALEKAHLIQIEIKKATKGNQKVCRNLFDEYVINFGSKQKSTDEVITVEMPVGLFIEYKVSAPCGMCTPEKIVGYLDTPESFLEPERIKAGLLWFEKGFVKYQFPNNSYNKKKPVKKLEIVVELSSEIPGTNTKWLSDITLSINDHEVGTWTSPGDFGDKRGAFTPEWWKLEGSQYGLLKTWTITDEGSFVDGMQISKLKIRDLNLSNHHSIKTCFTVKEDAENVGGINIFGQGFGNYNHDILLNLYF